ncbi:hypothetical protein [Paraflavitalea sp. CAU 1676]|uniref:hypothetical protein n=1 Tax=Paraflavitalea sp. CAU 1676 TaxID=3032598 RepID=UPI0023DA9A53|nr:hypothetical protein [Paraflavitalea sp. CAU 1676]MDF2193471.1 hypothetical protein [Paraflavitalea sp. CAU 1676]
MTSTTFETIICIPGNWNSWDELIVEIVAATNGEYLAAGNILMHAGNNKHYTIELFAPDDRMKASFKYAGMTTGVTELFLDDIERHKHVVYITGTTGNFEDARQMALVADAILKAGGLGVKIETVGKAFEKAHWSELLASFDEATLYTMFVLDSIMDESGTVFSCGMQNLGLKDTIVSGEELQQAVDLIKIFGFYQIVDKPTIHNGQTFATSSESPLYLITEEFYHPYQGDEVFGNPFGTWRLTKV